MDADQVLAFRLARSGLAVRSAPDLAAAAACPASDFARDAALLALAARREGISRAEYVRAIDDGVLVVAHVVRGAIHALAPGDVAPYGQALIASDDRELGAQLGAEVRRVAREHGLRPGEALAEVAAATRDALAGGRALGKDELHAELRARVRADLLPWCRTCGSHHVSPMLWRYATIVAGARLDSGRRYVRADPGPPARASEAVRRFLRFYAPATPGDFAEWAGVAGSHARRLWVEVADGLVEVDAGGRRAWAAREDVAALASPPSASGVRLLPPGDPYLQRPNRPLLASDPDLRKRLFRPVAGPGAVLRDGRLAGLWRARANGRRTEIAIEPLVRLSAGELEEEAGRLAALRGTADVAVTLA